MYYGFFFLFASLMILSVLFVFFLLPETKGVPLESMDRLFDRSLTPRKAHAIVMKEIQADEAEFRHNVEGSGFSIGKEGAEESRIESV
jgi:hypothetical protein